MTDATVRGIMKANIRAKVHSGTDIGMCDHYYIINKIDSDSVKDQRMVNQHSEEGSQPQEYAGM